MSTRILTAGVAVMLVIGCAKKSAKKPEPTTGDYASVKVQPPPAAQPSAKDSRKKADDGPNWLKPKQPDRELPEGKQGYGIPKLPPGATDPTAPPPNPDVQPVPLPGAPNPNPQPPGGGAAPQQPMPGGVLQPNLTPPTGTPTAPPKKVTKADMKDIWVFVENFSGAGGKMPTIPDVYSALGEAKSPAADLVKDGTILLTGATKRESVWAYEANALLNGGWVASQNGVEMLTAVQLQQRLRER